MNITGNKLNGGHTSSSLKTCFFVLLSLCFMVSIVLQLLNFYITNLQVEEMEILENRPLTEEQPCVCPNTVTISETDGSNVNPTNKNKSADEKDLTKVTQAPTTKPITSPKGPHFEYDGARRRLEHNSNEVMYLVNGELSAIEDMLKTISGTDFVKQRITVARQRVNELKRSLMRDVHLLTKYDGHSKWREEQKKQMSTLVQSRISKLQNPPSCKNGTGLPDRKNITCKVINTGCGFGCELFFLTRCLIVGYGTHRTLVMPPSPDWQYNKAGWESVFLPISSCNMSGVTQPDEFGTISSNEVNVPYIPMALPEEFADTLGQQHADPVAWWRGQFLRHVLRYQPGVAASWDKEIANIESVRPVVAIHVRGNDKTIEAPSTELNKYIEAAEEFFLQLELENEFPEKGQANKTTEPIKRRIYLAADSPDIWNQVKTKYPQYEFLGTSNFSAMAKSNRYNPTSLNGLLHDMHTMARCDLFVGTFTSTLGRRAYELQQTCPSPPSVQFWDSSIRTRSLDSVYWSPAPYSSAPLRRMIAVATHKSVLPGEIDVKPRDIIEIPLTAERQFGSGNLWNGFTKCINTRSKQFGFVPSHKLDEMPRSVKFPQEWNKKEKSAK